MNAGKEFETVDLLVASSAPTRAVDAFSLAFIKSERQLRRLFTYLVYQCPVFGPADVDGLRGVLAEAGDVFADGFIKGFAALYRLGIPELIGAAYPEMRARIDEATRYRNKIFHGQLTSSKLTRRDLLALTGDIRSWCFVLADAAMNEIGYDGFGRNSFRKSETPDLIGRYRRVLSSLEEYRSFVESVLARPRAKPKGR